MFLLDRLLWQTAGLQCLAIFLLAVCNKRIRTFPLFFGLVGYYPIYDWIFFKIQRVSSDAVWAWSTSFLMVSMFLVELTVLYQVANTLIFSRVKLAKLLKPLRRWTLVVLVLCTTVLAAMWGDVTPNGVTNALLRFSLGQDFLELCLLVALVMLTRTLGISWRNLPAGMALGWGISSLFNLAAHVVMRATHPISTLRGDAVRAAGFSACTLIWLWYTLRATVPASASEKTFFIADLDSHLADLDSEVIEEAERIL
jgi:hypothetical protein